MEDGKDWLRTRVLGFVEQGRSTEDTTARTCLQVKLDAMLGNIFHDVQQVKTMMDKYGVVCTGSRIVQYVLPAVEADDFDFVVPLDALPDVKVVFKTWGYTQVTQGLDSYYEGNPSPIEFVLSVTRLRHPDKPFSVDLLQSSTPDIMKTILAFDGTAAMNCLGTQWLFMAYPKETLAMKNIVNGRYYLRSAGESANALERRRMLFLDKYERKGFKTVFLPYPGHVCHTDTICCVTGRSLTDNESLYITLEAEATGVAAPTALWTLGGGVHYCPKRYGIQVGDIAEETCLLTYSLPEGRRANTTEVRNRIHRVLSILISDEDELLEFMSTVSIILVGPRCLQVAIPTVCAHDFHFVVKRGDMTHVTNFFAQWGYSLQSEGGVEGMAIEGLGMQGIERVAILAHSVESFNVLIMESDSSYILSPIINAKETAMMNFLSSNAYYMAYPAITLSRHTVTMGYGSEEKRSSVVGFANHARERHVCGVDPVCPRLERNVMDKHGLIVVFRGRTLGVATSDEQAGQSGNWNLQARYSWCIEQHKN